MSRAGRSLDVVVWGATGFTGRLVAEYLARTGPSDLRWGIAGRNKAKLEEVKASLGDKGSKAEVLVHDAASLDSMTALARATKVVCTTVGPYGRYGLPLAQACAAEGTDYCDITGEPPFMRKVIDACDAKAKESKSRIVHTCGFDSIPSDLGVFLLAEHAGSKPFEDVRLVLTDSRGGVSGGTAASALDILDSARADPAVRKLLSNPCALDPDPSNSKNLRRRRRSPVSYDREIGSFVAPFPMGLVNSLVVRRSNALFGYRYGRGFSYKETMVVGRAMKGLPGAVGLVAGWAGFIGAATFGPTRKLVEKRLPKPGEGPSARSRDRGYFKMTLFATFEGDKEPSLAAHVEGVNDPGYGETAKMLGESALCLALDPPAPGFEGGVLTPATAMGSSLVDRLRRAHMRFDVQHVGS
jgi:short subunit dehydrogenase-like uncharacterized protein